MSTTAALILSMKRHDIPDEVPLRPTYHEAFTEWTAKAKALGDPITLIVIDEADRLRTDSLEQVRSLLDEGSFGVV